MNGWGGQYRVLGEPTERCCVPPQTDTERKGMSHSSARSKAGRIWNLSEVLRDLAQGMFRPWLGKALQWVGPWRAVAFYLDAERKQEQLGSLLLFLRTTSG